MVFHTIIFSEMNEMVNIKNSGKNEHIPSNLEPRDHLSIRPNLEYYCYSFTITFCDFDLLFSVSFQ